MSHAVPACKTIYYSQEDIRFHLLILYSLYRLDITKRNCFKKVHHRFAFHFRAFVLDVGASFGTKKFGFSAYG
ncbi:hypothetical protein L2E82_50864 [Cichorium intybus]|nr:hypothetical protein L2E82_50864 [Cichorium intybus]